MTQATWQLLVDINKDNLYNHARSDLSAYVLSVDWENGMSDAYEDFAAPASLKIVLDNAGGEFDFERPAALYYGLLTRGQHVRLRATFSSTTYTMFDGVITSIDLDVGVYSPNRCKIKVEDYMLALLDAEYSPPLQTNVRTDQVLRTMLGSGLVPLPYARSHWVLDYSLLETNTVLFDESIVMALDTGKTTLEYAGDMTGGDESTSAQRFAREIVAAEMGGRFFYNAKTGLFTFHSRHSFVGRSSSFTLTEADLDKAQINSGVSDIANDITVSYTPRRSLGEMVVYSSSSTIQLGYMETKTIRARYRDASGSLARIGVVSGIQPRLGIDYNVIDIPTGLLNDPTWVDVRAEFGGTEAKITFSSQPQSHVAVVGIYGIQLRGTAVGQYDQTLVNLMSADSIGAYERQPKRATLKVGSPNNAESYAQWMLNEFSSPRPRLERITFIASKSSTLMTHALARQIGDVGRVTLSSKNHDREYELVGEQHRLKLGGEHTLTTTWILKPLNRGWQLQTAGYGELGQTTYLGL